jgi:hypothetical protein
LARISIVTSIDAGSREKYLKIRGKDLYDKVWENLHKYLSVDNRNVTLQYIALDNNVGDDDIDGFITMCKKHSVCKIMLSRDNAKYRGPASTEDTDMPEFMLRGMANLYYQALQNNIECNFMPGLLKSEIDTIKQLADSMAAESKRGPN